MKVLVCVGKAEVQYIDVLHSLNKCVVTLLCDLLRKEIGTTPVGITYAILDNKGVVNIGPIVATTPNEFIEEAHHYDYVLVIERLFDDIHLWGRVLQHKNTLVLADDYDYFNSLKDNELESLVDGCNISRMPLDLKQQYEQAVDNKFL